MPAPQATYYSLLVMLAPSAHQVSLTASPVASIEAMSSQLVPAGVDMRWSLIIASRGPRVASLTALVLSSSLSVRQVRKSIATQIINSIEALQRQVTKSFLSSSTSGVIVRKQVGKLFTISSPVSVFIQRLIAKSIQTTSSSIAIVQKQVTKLLMVLAASLGIPLLRRQIGHGISVLSTSVVSQSRFISKSLSLFSPAAATILRFIPKTLTAPISSSLATSIRQISKQLATTSLAINVSITKQISKLLSVVASSVATRLLSTAKMLTALSSSIATLGAIKAKNILVTATAVNFSTTIVKQVGKGISTTSGFVAVIQKQIGKLVTVISPAIGILSATKQFFPVLLAALSLTSVSIRKQITKFSTTAANSTVRQVRLVTKPLSTSLVGSIAILTVLKAKLATLTTTSASLAVIARLIAKSIATTPSSIALIVKQVGIRRSTNPTATAVAQRQVLKLLNFTSTTITSLVSGPTTALRATSTVIATLRQSVGLRRSAIVTSIVSPLKTVNRHLTLSSAVSVFVTRQTTKTLSATAHSSALMFKGGLTRTLSAVSSASVTLTTNAVKFVPLIASTVAGFGTLVQTIGKLFSVFSGSITQESIQVTKAGPPPLPTPPLIFTATLDRTIHFNAVVLLNINQVVNQ